MKRKRSNKKQRDQKAAIIRNKEINEMAEHKPSREAQWWFKRPAYQLGSKRGDTD